MKMMKIYLAGLALLCFLIISLLVYADTIERAELMSVSGISRVFMHEPGCFTFLVKNTDSKKVGQLRVCSNENNVIISEDLEESQSIRVEYSCRPYHHNECNPISSDSSNWNVRTARLTIHLHSVKEIDGAGWNHGKFGSGQTVVVQ